MSRRSALVVGEALIDEFPDRRVVAGAPLHVAAHLASIGWEVAMVTRVGDDADGLAILSALEAHGVDTSLVEVDPELATGVTRIEMAGTEHSFEVVYPAAWDAIVGPERVPEVDVVDFGTLALRDARTRGALERILEHAKATVVVDLNLRAPHWDQERIMFAVAAAQILKLNEDELPEACRAFGLPSDLAALHGAGPEWICVTRGPAGADLSHRDGGAWSSPAPDVEVVDTVGSGDAFCATLIDGILAGRDPGEVLETAVRRGAEIASQRGGLPEPPG